MVRKIAYSFKTLILYWFPLFSVVAVVLILIGLSFQFGLFIITALLLPFIGGVALFLFLFRDLPAKKEDIEFEVFYKKILESEKVELEKLSNKSGISLGKLEDFVSYLFDTMAVNFVYDSSAKIIYTINRRKDIVRCPVCGSLISDHGRGKCSGCKSVYSLVFLNGPNNYLLSD